MEMFLMALCLSFFGLAVVAAAFGAATRAEAAAQPAEQEAAAVPVTIRPQFFAGKAFLPEPLPPRVSIEALLLQIENHIRLEHAAAESFVASPTPALLHCKTISTLIH